MLKLLLILIGSMVAIGGLAVGGIAAAFATGALQVPEVEEVQNTWGEVNEERTEVRTSIVINNPNRIGLGLDNLGLGANVFLNDVQIAEGGTQGVSVPEGRSTLELLTRIENRQIAAWWPTHIANGERTTVRISPYGNARILGWGLDVPGPSFNEEFDTDLLEGANSDEPQDVPLAIGGTTLATLTIQSRAFGWGGADEELTQIDGIVVIRNNAEVPIPISRIAFTFTMNGIVIGQGATEDPAVLVPGQDTPVPVEFSVTNAKLIEWWPTHISNDERTLYRIDVDAFIDVDLPFVGSHSFDVPLVSYEDEFRTNIMGN